MVQSKSPGMFGNFLSIMRGPMGNLNRGGGRRESRSAPYKDICLFQHVSRLLKTRLRSMVKIYHTRGRKNAADGRTATEPRGDLSASCHIIHQNLDFSLGPGAAPFSRLHVSAGDGVRSETAVTQTRRRGTNDP